MYNMAKYVEIVYIYGECKVNPTNGQFAGFVDNPGQVLEIDLDRYYLGYRWKSYKQGCSPDPGNPNPVILRPDKEYTILQTAGNSGLCGVRTMQPGWYVLSLGDSFQDPDFYQRFGICNIILPWDELTYEDYIFAESNKEEC